MKKGIMREHNHVQTLRTFIVVAETESHTAA